MSDWEMVRRDIGEEAADILMRQYGGILLYIPTKQSREAKHKAIVEEFYAGASYNALARKYGYSADHVRVIITKQRMKHTQQPTSTSQSLF